MSNTIYVNKIMTAQMANDKTKLMIAVMRKEEFSKINELINSACAKGEYSVVVDNLSEDAKNILVESGYALRPLEDNQTRILWK